MQEEYRKDYLKSQLVGMRYIQNEGGKQLYQMSLVELEELYEHVERMK